MKKRVRSFLMGFGVLILVSMVSQAAGAATLSLSPAFSSGIVGHNFNIDVVISGLEENTDLSAFDLNINYDNSILAFDSYTLASGLGDVGLGEAEDWSSGDLGNGVINLVELSLLEDLSFQPDSFSMATISFTGAGFGSSLLWLSDVTLGDALGISLDATLENGNIEVTAVPVPSAVWLLVSGLIGIVGIRKV